LATAGNDTIDGSWASERLVGLDGNDILRGLDGDDGLDGGAGNDILEGGSGDDFLRCGSGDDMLRGGSGADTIVGGAGADRLEGNEGGDTYVYNLGDGDDELFDYGGWNDAADTIVFGAGIAAADLIFSRVASDWHDIKISFVGNSGSILIDNQQWGDAGIEAISFADGTSWNHAELTARYVADQQTSGDDIIHGSDLPDVVEAGAGNDRIITGKANDTLIGNLGNDRLEGGEGNDTYVYNLGDGDDVIADFAGWDSQSSDAILFGQGISASDLLFSRVSNDWNSIRISFVGQAGSIFVESQQWGDAGIEAVIFADGTIWNLAQLTARYVADQQTAGDDVIHGSYLPDMVEAGAGNDRVIVGDGNDSINGGAGNDRLEGGGGNDTYVYSLGDGDDVIAD
jgi:Ca2+-binding RTX toxin-like protein